MLGSDDARSPVAAVWRCGTMTFDLRRARVMGVVNATPDSFSDGGDHFSSDDAIRWAISLLDDGADIIDVGGESTRPGFDAVSITEELRRVLPVVSALAEMGVAVSIDTRHAEVARAAVAAGACIINDVSGFTDEAMLDVASNSSCGCVVVHSTPASLTGMVPNRQSSPDYVREVADYLCLRSAYLVNAGIEKERICIDPGPGFGTVPDEDVAVQLSTAELASLGYPLMCAVSRKRFVGALSGVRVARERDSASVGVAISAVSAGARVVRAHNVAVTSQALRAFEACSGTPCERFAIVGMGSNIGEGVPQLAAALDRIDALPLTHVERASSVWMTEPAYLEEQARFTNAVALVRTALHPASLLTALLSIEDDFGRKRTVPNGARTLDLDLVWMEHERHAGTRLILPHPRAGERDFVLVPLAELLGGEDALHEFCTRESIAVRPRCERVGRVIENVGTLR